MNNPIVEVTNLSVYFGQTEVLKDISFQIMPNDFVGLVGPNGSGKTTLVKAVLNLISISKGKIKLFGQDKIRWNQVGYLPQKLTNINNLFPATVYEVVLLGLLSQKKGLKLINNQDRQQVMIILQELKIIDLKNRLFSELSGGQQQKVLLARALVSKPKLLIFDEPSTALDPKSRKEFFSYVKKLNKEKKITIILITHDTGYIGNYANKLLYIDRKLVYFGGISGFCPSKKNSSYFEKSDDHIIWHQHS